MLDRDKLNFWVRIVAVSLAAIFILSSVFLGIGTEVNYNLFDLIGGRNEQQTAQNATGTQEQIQSAEEYVRENPRDADAIQGLAALYIQNNRLEEAEGVLEKGRETAPKDPEIALLLGQVYAQQAGYASEQEKLYENAGDAFAAAAGSDPENAQAFLLAGQAYEQAGEPAEAIEYYNGYLDRAPDGEQAGAVKDRISALLEGRTAAGGAGNP